MSIRRLTYTASTIAILVCIIGFAIDFDGFGLNFLAELAGVVASVAVALALVDKVVEKHSQAAWRAVRQRTLEGIVERISSILFEIDVETGTAGKAPRVSYTPQWNDDGKPTIGLVWTMINTARDIEKYAEDFDKGLNRLLSNVETTADDPSRRMGEAILRKHDLDHGSTRSLLRSVESKFHYLQTVLCSRVFELGGDTRLIELILDMERDYEKWRECAYLVEEWGMPESFAWQSVAQTVRSMSNIIRFVANSQ